MIKTIILEYMDLEIRKILNNLNEDFFQKLEEIRLRINKPIIIYEKNNEYTVTKEGQLTKNILNGYIVSKENIFKIIEIMSSFSLYAFENELKSGYITLKGGHRVGISGKVVINNGEIKTIKNISGLNIRISHEIFNCSKNILDYIVMPYIKHSIIISPPACGKTTLLRDIVRQISNGVDGKFKGQTVAVIDERSEIAGCLMGIPQNNVGIRTDVLDGCPKGIGMLMLLRAMSPKVIAVDEIGKKEDMFAIEEIINCGVKIICTVHGKSIEDLKQKPVLCEIINKKIFETYILLSNEKGPGTVKNIYDKDFEEVY